MTLALLADIYKQDWRENTSSSSYQLKLGRSTWNARLKNCVQLERGSSDLFSTRASSYFTDCLRYRDARCVHSPNSQILL